MERSLLGVLRTFSQLVFQSNNLKQKSTWGFENLFPTMRELSSSVGEVYLGFWEPFPNHVEQRVELSRSLLGVLRTFSQLSTPWQPLELKSTWGFENLFPTTKLDGSACAEVYLGFWEPFPNRLWQWWRWSWSLLGVLRTFSQRRDQQSPHALKSTWGFENLFPTALRMDSLSLRSLLGVLRTFSQLLYLLSVEFQKSTWGFENLFPTWYLAPMAVFEVYLGFWEPFPNYLVASLVLGGSLLGVLRTFSQLLLRNVLNWRKSTWGFENLFPTTGSVLVNKLEVYLGFWEPFPNCERITQQFLRSLLGVLRTFSQRWARGLIPHSKSTWGFENLFPTSNAAALSLDEVYLGFWEPFPNFNCLRQIAKGSLLGVLRTFSQPNL